MLELSQNYARTMPKFIMLELSQNYTRTMPKFIMLDIGPIMLERLLC